MIGLLLDTNVILDVLLERQPHVEDSAALWVLIESGNMRGYLAAHAITTIHYLLSRDAGESRARKAVASLMSVFSVAPVNDKVIAEALGSPSRDFEDAVTSAAARHAGCSFIVTRDPRGFTGSAVKAIAPAVAAALLKT